MLNIISRKLCPLLSLALATMGCGKKISEETTASATAIETQEMPSALVMKLNPETSKTTYSVPRNANIFLPDILWVREGNPTGKTIVISYNLKDSEADEFDYKCTYTATAPSNMMPLKDCVNAYGDVFSDVSRFDFPVNYGRFIRMELQGTTGLSVDAVYTVDWI